LGIDHLRMNRLEDAQQSFQRARERDSSLDVPVQYYEGVISYRERDLDAAESRFAAVERGMPNSAIGRESSRFLDLIHRTQRTTYAQSGTGALEYDSNVPLGPGTATPTVPGAITGQGD